MEKTRHFENKGARVGLNSMLRIHGAVITIIIIIAAIIGFALGYIFGVNKRIFSDDDLSTAEYLTEQLNNSSAYVYDTNNTVLVNEETSVIDSSVSYIEVPAQDDLPDENQQYIPWRFFMYEEPDLSSMKVGSSPPSNIQINEKGEDGWVQIEMDGDTSWVYTIANLYNIDRWVNIYFNIEDEEAIGDLSPQIVEIVAQKDNWLQISTELGDRWVDPNSIRSSVRLDVLAYNQTELGYPLGCELVSLAMMMNYKTEVDISDLYNELPLADLPYEGFRGDPASSTRGWTIFPPALSGMMIKHLGSSYDMSNLEIADLREQINSNAPVVVWIRGLGWSVHALCLTGYDESGFYYNDPWTGAKDTYIIFDDFYAIWNEPIYDSVLNLTYTPRKALSYYP